ncbi:hypothetical protein F4561_006575 [Lipingzhangella halophila]|uniref:Acb2/Tad1 hairpin domain-containing protein n=1 Tax=Lipingzhangella halophila TaxID=1783352 RepID=A0A7W7RQF1_9ACTN|nr:hypothetical protein [Lipingzhangella halophila]MBB4935666.1 hypothetical protein [Lipingzhangella halophila]
MADPQEPGKVTGYRHHPQDRIDLVNRIKAIENELGFLVAELNARDDIDKRALALGRTHLQTGFMWTVRAVFQPESNL